MSNYNITLQSNNADLQAILNTINELPEAVEQATPEISVDSSGLITATAGDKSSTYQLAFQVAKTITPTAVNQVAVSSGYYTGGNVIVEGDANLIAENIKSGVSIFGVNGTLEEGDGGSDTENELVERTITSYINNGAAQVGAFAFARCVSLSTVSVPIASYIGSSAFHSCSNLREVNMPNVQRIGDCAFEYCTKLTNANFPVATSIGSYAFKQCFALSTVSLPMVTSVFSYVFQSCAKLSEVNLPAATYIGVGAFYRCSSLTTANIPAAQFVLDSVFVECKNLTTVSLLKASIIYANAFCRCYNLKSLYLTGSSICRLSRSNAFSSTPIDGYSVTAGTYGSIYVPASLLTSYQEATNWTYFSSRFVGI